MSYLADTDNASQPFSLANQYEVQSFEDAFNTDSLKRFYNAQDKENNDHEILDNAEQLIPKQNGSSLSTYIQRINDDNPAYQIEQELNSHVELESNLLKSNDLQETDPLMSDIINGMSNMTVNKEVDPTKKDYHAEQKEQFMKEYQIGLGKGTAEDFENIDIDKIHKNRQYIIPSSRELQKDKNSKHQRSYSSEKKDTTVSTNIPAQRRASIGHNEVSQTKHSEKEGESEPSLEKGVGRLVMDYFKTIYSKKPKTEA